MSSHDCPHTIANGAGERLTFLRRDGDRLEVENVVAPGSGPPMHVHHYVSPQRQRKEHHDVERYVVFT